MKAPITPPTSGAAQQQFELQRVDYGAPEAGGRVGGVQAGFPLWKLVWTLGNVGRDRPTPGAPSWTRCAARPAASWAATWPGLIPKPI
jgi:hypothetical protein